MARNVNFFSKIGQTALEKFVTLPEADCNAVYYMAFVPQRKVYLLVR